MSLVQNFDNTWYLEILTGANHESLDIASSSSVAMLPDLRFKKNIGIIAERLWSFTFKQTLWEVSKQLLEKSFEGKLQNMLVFGSEIQETTSIDTSKGGGLVTSNLRRACKQPTGLPVGILNIVMFNLKYLFQYLLAPLALLL